MHEPPIHTIQVPSPFPEGTTNVYLIDAAPVTLIDTGIGTRTAQASLEESLGRLGRTLDQIEQIILTHKHADHIGLVSRIVERSAARVYIHADDLDGLVHLDQRHQEYLPLVQRRLAEWGVPAADIDALATTLGGAPRMARPAHAEPLADGDRLPAGDLELEVIHTPGHTQGSICLRYAQYLFSGDHVLPAISPNIGASELRRSQMLVRYVTALKRVAALDDGRITVLPGHGPSFTHLAARCEKLARHHRQREDRILSILDGQPSMTVYEVARVLWGELASYHLLLGTAEANAHLEKLVAEGRAQNEGGAFRAA